VSTLLLEVEGPARRVLPLRLLAGALAALGLHAGVLLIALSCEGASYPAPLVITEVDLSPAASPPPEPAPPLVEPEAPQPAPSAPKLAPRARQAASLSPPRPAAAGALHTANEDAPSSGEPVRFAVDAQGEGYGFGVVAAGGTSTQRGGVGGAPEPQASAPGPANGDAKLRSFAVPPRLSEVDPCRGFFPQAASVDRGQVTLTLVVSSEGRVSQASVRTEQPAGQGFGRAALLCLRDKRFSPAQDEQGRAQAAEAPVAVRFSR
jgi:protein TonB